ncbi:hypothetical protein SPD53_14815 [Oceanobacillus sp. MO10714A]
MFCSLVSAFILLGWKDAGIIFLLMRSACRNEKTNRLHFPFSELGMTEWENKQAVFSLQLTQSAGMGKQTGCIFLSAHPVC